MACAKSAERESGQFGGLLGVFNIGERKEKKRTERDVKCSCSVSWRKRAESTAQPGTPGHELVNKHFLLFLLFLVFFWFFFFFFTLRLLLLLCTPEACLLLGYEPTSAQQRIAGPERPGGMRHASLVRSPLKLCVAVICSGTCTEQALCV